MCQVCMREKLLLWIDTWLPMTSRGMQKKSHLLIIINCVLITSKFCQIFQYLRKLNRFKMKMKGEKRERKKNLKQSNRLITHFRAMHLITYIYKEVLIIWIFFFFLVVNYHMDFWLTKTHIH